ncbi:Aspyridones efflux protein apdF [Psilocybe cubensis]|uniref:Aspyridones efflux protein apdF n=1 Tax=Psilocybe cubensis TaxID=181762 RepID=A0ACB8HAZ3_PSICU|nr:Aspyridones efflux protein apdF [Psilocybe cubensis]KAH9484905.1 Aspyridones efflux protein apdF [Psilocybe cubensis]
MSMPKPVPLPSSVSTPAPIRASWTAVLKDARNDWPYILVLCQGFIMCLGTFVPPTYLQLYAETHGTSKQASFYALAVLNFSGVFGRIVPNYLADKFGALGFAMLGAGTPQGVFPFAIFYGFFFGGTNGMYLPLINSLSTGSADHLKRCGISLIPPAVAALIGLPITGAILGPDFIWWRGILFASMSMLIATILVIIAKILFDRRNAAAKQSEKLTNSPNPILHIKDEVQ